MAPLLPTAKDICETVADELAVAGGIISETVEYGERLFVRSLLPALDEVRPKDVVQGGIAVMTDETKIDVHPYLLRQVCRNGAIMPQLIETHSISRIDFSASTEDIEAVDTELREALRSCSATEVFSNGIEHFRMAAVSATSQPVFWLLFRSAMSHRISSRVQAEIMRRFSQDRDRSMFGLVNAVTSVARDQRDPEVRWRLEELGGGILATKSPEPDPEGCEAEVVDAAC